jgi:chemotaxis response regulator CheB
LAELCKLYNLLQPVYSEDYWPATDVTSVTLASSYDSKVLGVILTSAGQDGALGALTINRTGGKVIAQEYPEVHGMPDAAILIDDVGFIKPLAEIAPLLVDLVTKGKPT